MLSKYYFLEKRKGITRKKKKQTLIDGGENLSTVTLTFPDRLFSSTAVSALQVTG